MADDKSIRFRIDADDSAFQEKMRQIQQRVRDMQRSQQAAQRTAVGGAPVGPGGQFSDAARRAFERETTAHRQQLIKDEVKLQSELSKKEKIAERLSKLVKEQSLEQKQLNQMSENQVRTWEKYLQVVQQVSQAHKNLGDIQQTTGTGAAGLPMGQQPELAGAGFRGDLRGRAGNVRAFRGMGFGRGTSRFLSRFGGPMAVAGGIAAGAGAGMQIGSSVWDEIAERQRNIALAQGAATRRAADPMRRMMEGRGIEDVYFAEERKKALTAVGEEMETRTARDILRAAGTSRGLLGTAGALGAGLVGATGGMMVGGIPGAIQGGVAAYGAANLASSAMVDKRTRGALGQTLGLWDSGEYTAEQAREALENIEKTTEAEKAKNWRKTLTLQNLQKKRGFYKRFQEQFGTGDAFAAGGMLEEILETGVSGAEGATIAGQMMGASGMTTGREQVPQIREAYEMQRGGFTPAARMMGVMRGLSQGFGGGTDNLDESMRKFFASAMKSGIDDSKMVEEMRQFASASIELATREGIGVEEAAAEIGKGQIGAPTAQSLQASLTAQQLRSQMSKDQGAGLQFKLGYARSERGKKLLGGISDDMKDVIQFATLDVNQITEDSPIVRSLMEKMGVDNIEEFKSKKQEFDLAGGIKTKGTFDRFMSFAKELGGMTPKDREAYLRTKEGQTESQEISAQMALEVPGLDDVKFRQFLTFASKTGETLEPRRPGLSARQLREGVRQEMRDGEMVVIDAEGNVVPSGAEELGEGYGKRGRGLLETALEGAQAGQELGTQRLMVKGGEEGEKSPIEMLRDSAMSYDATSQIMREASEKMAASIIAGDLPAEHIREMRDAMVKLESAITGGGEERRQDQEQDKGTLPESFMDMINSTKQPSPKFSSGDKGG